jgi:hypothetical protein
MTLLQSIGVGVAFFMRFGYTVLCCSQNTLRPGSDAGVHQGGTGFNFLTPRATRP